MEEVEHNDLKAIILLQKVWTINQRPIEVKRNSTAKWENPLKKWTSRTRPSSTLQAPA